MINKTYALITAAYNEEKNIEKTITAVCCQTILPKKWIIISDGSTDSTDKIVQHYAKKYEFIIFIRLGNDQNRNFSKKVNALTVGYNQIKDIQFDFLGILDADISFDAKYYENIILKFRANTRLGISGGVIKEKENGKYKRRSGDSDQYVAGAMQVFSRKCYEEIGGFIPLKYGGEDAVACKMAKMRGWEVKPFSDLEVFHHRRTGSGGGSVWRSRLYWGIRDYFLAYHPLFMLVKCLGRIKEKPYFIGAIFWMYGFFIASVKMEKRNVPDAYIKYFRNEQMNRLKELFFLDIESKYH